MYDFNDPEFQRLIKEKGSEIIEHARNQILDHPNYPILVDNYLYNFWANRASKIEMFVIVISEDDLFKLRLDKVQDSLIQQITQVLKTCCFVTVNSEFDVINTSGLPYQNTPEARELFIQLSKKYNCVFFFGEEGVTKFIRGEEKGNNIFFSPEDRLQHQKKFTIEQIKSALAKYRDQHLTKQHVYIKFFEHKGIIERMYGNSNTKNFQHNKNLLRNSPEKYFRDDLIDFLNEHVQGTFNREMQLLSSKKPIDIHTETKKGKLVFFEVKWLGECKHKDKDEVSTAYINNDADYRANEGVVQTLKYIEEVIIKMNRDLQCGYLLIFDCRNDRASIKYNDINKIPEDLRSYYNEKFDKIDDLIVNNVHPSD